MINGDPHRTAAVGLISRRRERADDDAFRYALFCVSRPPGDDLAGLDGWLRDTVMHQQFFGQTATYRARYPQACFDIVYHDDAPIGRIVVDESPTVLQLVDIALMPTWRGRGIGTRLVTTLCRAAGQAKIPLRLSVLRSNVDAVRLYTRLGFVATTPSAIDVQFEWTAAQPPGSSPTPGPHAMACGAPGVPPDGRVA